MSMLYKEIDDFEAFAYHQKQFKKITKKDLLGKWNLFFFYPADFTFVCPTELEDLQENIKNLKMRMRNLCNFNRYPFCP